MRCWGLNDIGQLGRGDAVPRGDQPGELDTPGFVDFGAARRVVAMGSGRDFSCAALHDGIVKCFGRSVGGSLGHGDSLHRGQLPSQLGDSLPVTRLGVNRTATGVLAVGNYHSCALLDNGAVKCWGESDQGQLGYGDTTNRGDAPSELGDGLPSVDLGATDVVDLACGAKHTCALFSSALVKCWGRSGVGQLGLGTTSSRGDGPDEMGLALPFVAFVALTSSPSTAPVALRPTRMPVPTRKPTAEPTKRPTLPTRSPTIRPTKRPTNAPTTRPTKSPTDRPSRSPTPPTTLSPTRSPTRVPTKRPTTASPTKRPTSEPTRRPSKAPTRRPTKRPTKAPTTRPTRSPTG